MPKRSTATRDRHRDIIRRTGAPCALCGEAIDYSLPHLDPMAFVVDHIDPYVLSGDDSLANKQAAHRKCNRDKGDRIDGGPVIRRSGSLVRPGGVTP